MKNKCLIHIKKDIKNNNEFLFISGIVSIFYALLLIFPLYDVFLKIMPDISDFSNHVISAASASNLNISSRINSYLFMLFLVAVLVLTFFVLIYKFFHDHYKIELDGKVKEYIRDTSLIGIAVIIASIFTTNKEYAAYIVGGAVIIGWIFIIQKDKNKDFNIIIWSLLTSAPISIYIYIITMRYNFIAELFNKQILLQLQVSSVAYFAFIWVFISIIYYFVSNKILCSLSETDQLNCKNALVISVIPLLLTGIIQSILLEILNILNKNYGVVFGRPYRLYSILMFLATLISILIFAFLKNRKNKKLDISSMIYKFYMPVILITFSCMSVQPWRMAIAGNEYFEMANHGLSVDQFFRFGSIPFIESFDAHMMSNQLFAYIYSWINGYEPWAAFLYNNYSYLFYIVPMFYILRKLIGAINSFFFILCFPLITNLFNVMYLLSGLIAICIIRMISNPKKTYFYLFWITSIILCFYKLDLGSSALLSGFLVYFITCYIFRKQINILKIVLPGVFLASIILLLFTVICLFKEISPTNRFIEFVKLCMSNQNWAYTSVGNSDMLAYTIGYYVLPLVAIICAVWIIGKNIILNMGKDSSLLHNDMNPINKDAFVMFVFFFIFFILNVSRGIVRHSFAEGSIVFIVGTIPLALLSLAVLNKNSRKSMINFLVVGVSIVILINVNIASYNGFEASVMSNALLSSSYQEQYKTPYAFDGTRVKGEAMPPDAEYLKIVLDTILTPNETYFDFASVNYFYALVGRKNPIYVNQSPLMISDDSTQNYALTQIKKVRPPIVLMPIKGNAWDSIDGITVDYKYYMISEYVYDNYEPLIRLPMFDIYCFKDNKELYISKLSEKDLINKTLYAGSFDFVNVQQLLYNNCKVEIDNKKNISFIPSGNDPYVIGFMDQLKKSNSKIKDSVGIKIPTHIKIDFSAKSEGRIQLFYILNNGEKFSEKNSIAYPINYGGTGSASFELPSVPYEIRIDVDTKEFAIQGLNISQGLQLLKNQPENWVRNIGAIPRLWAENSGEKIFEEAPNLQVTKSGTTSYNVNTRGIPQNKPIYLLLQIESEIDCNATLDLSDSKNKLGEFNFTISNGKHSYALRLSTDYHWWRDETKYITFMTDKPVNITKFCFIPVDSNEFYNVKEEYTLSNLSHINLLSN